MTSSSSEFGTFTILVLLKSGYERKSEAVFGLQRTIANIEMHEY